MLLLVPGGDAASEAFAELGEGEAWLVAQQLQDELHHHRVALEGHFVLGGEDLAAGAAQRAGESAAPAEAEDPARLAADAAQLLGEGGEAAPVAGTRLGVKARRERPGLSRVGEDIKPPRARFVAGQGLGESLDLGGKGRLALDVAGQPGQHDDLGAAGEAAGTGTGRGERQEERKEASHRIRIRPGKEIRFH